MIRGEPLLLAELIGNLIENAIAYAGSGAEITVRVMANEAVVLEVEDNGPGIPPDHIEAVRRRFARGGGGNKPGAGLGLPIVEEIAELFGARLELLTPDTGRGLLARVSFAITDERCAIAEDLT